MIRIHLGNIGSGKTLTLVREMYRNQGKRKYYSNIVTSLPNNTHINQDMIIKKNLVEEKVVKGVIKRSYDLKLNVDYWKEQPKPLVVALDEFHAIAGSRTSMSKRNILIGQWLALIRRVVNSSTQEGELICITQFLHKVDINLREMATQLRFHRCHYRAVCPVCHIFWSENSDMPKDLKHDFCIVCGGATLKQDHVIEVFHFDSIDNYFKWHFNHEKSFYNHYLLRNVAFYFDKYDTLTWDNLFDDS